MKRCSSFLCLILYGLTAWSQPPKLLVGIVIDQMRWDFLYRYQNRYAASGGFQMLMNKGFSLEQMYIPYIPTVTAAGHASIYTGTTPSKHGIVGNEWYDRASKQLVTSVQDDSLGKSPRKLWSTTIGDQLKLSNNQKSRVFSVSLKDRSSILPGGWLCDVAFWWNNKQAKWQTSAYYKNIPAWVEKENSFVKNLADSLYRLNWKTLYPLSTYTRSTSDTQTYEQGFLKGEVSYFPYRLDTLISKNYEAIAYTPYGAALTFAWAKTLIEKEQLGKNPAGVSDMLSLSISSTDLIGHLYGPYSVETEDMYLRLDAYLGEFITYLDQQVGRDNYLLFLTADHGVAPVPEGLALQGLLSERFSEPKERQQINTYLQKTFQIKDDLVEEIENNQLYLHRQMIQQKGLDYKQVADHIVAYYQQDKRVLFAFECNQYLTTLLPTEIKEKFAQGFQAQRSGDIQLIFKPFVIDSYQEGKGTSHSMWNAYDAHIPNLWLGAGIRRAKSYKQYSIADIATTICAILQIEPPSASTGKVIEELLLPIRKQLPSVEFIKDTF